MTEGPLTQIAYIFKGGTVTYKNPNGEQSGTFRLYPTQRPKAIDKTVDGKTIREIYKLTDDTLTLCARNKLCPIDARVSSVRTTALRDSYKASSCFPSVAVSRSAIA